jgi:3-dehydroquinate synthase
MAGTVSKRMLGFSSDDLLRITTLLNRAQLPIRPPAITSERWLELMQRDKKVERGEIRLVLLKTLGRAVSGVEVVGADLRSIVDGSGG